MRLVGIIPLAVAVPVVELSGEVASPPNSPDPADAAAAAALERATPLLLLLPRAECAGSPTGLRMAATLTNCEREEDLIGEFASQGVAPCTESTPPELRFPPVLA